MISGTRDCFSVVGGLVNQPSFTGLMITKAEDEYAGNAKYKG
jgi:hypothetical protein